MWCQGREKPRRSCGLLLSLAFVALSGCSALRSPCCDVPTNGHALAVAQAVMHARRKLDHELFVAGDLEHGQSVIAEVDGVQHRGRQAVGPIAGRPVGYDRDPFRPHRQRGGGGCAEGPQVVSAVYVA